MGDPVTVIVVVRSWVTLMVNVMDGSVGVTMGVLNVFVVELVIVAVFVDVMNDVTVRETESVSVTWSVLVRVTEVVSVSFVSVRRWDGVSVGSDVGLVDCVSDSVTVTVSEIDGVPNVLEGLSVLVRVTSTVCEPDGVMYFVRVSRCVFVAVSEKSDTD